MNKPTPQQILDTLMTTASKAPVPLAEHQNCQQCYMALTALIKEYEELKVDDKDPADTKVKKIAEAP